MPSLRPAGLYPIALAAGNGAPTNKFECVRQAAWSAASFFHVACGLRFGEARAIDALDHRAARLPIFEMFDPDNIATEITTGLAIPREIAPTRAQMVGKDQTLKILPAKILEMDWPDSAGDDVRHGAAFISAAL